MTGVQQSKGLIHFIAVLAGLGGFLFGYDTGAISGALLYIKNDFGLGTLQEEATVAILLLGATFSAAFAGIIADRIGRKPSIIIASAVFFIAALLMALAPNFIVLLVGRALVGVAIGIASMTVPLYVSELSPPDVRGVCVAINQLMITFGILSAYIINYFFALSENWRMMLGISAIPALTLLIAMLFLPETPRWLLSQGRKNEALGIFKLLGSAKDEIAAALEIIHTKIGGSWGDFKKLLTPAIFPAVFTGTALAILQQVTGINTVIYYAPTILSSAGQQSDTTAILSTLGIGLVNVVMTIVSLFLIDRVGRRPLLIIGTTIMVIALAFLGIVNAVPEYQGSLTFFYNASLFLYIGGFAIGLGPITWLFMSEAYPQDIRGEAMSVATLANWGSNFLVAMTFLSILNTLGPSMTFLLYAFISIITVIFVYQRIPETKGKTLEEIQSFWKQNKE